MHHNSWLINQQFEVIFEYVSSMLRFKRRYSSIKADINKLAKVLKTQVTNDSLLFRSTQDKSSACIPEKRAHLIQNWIQ